MITKSVCIFGLALGLTHPFAHVWAKSRETVLYSFCSQQKCADGSYPHGGLIADKNGNLFGTTYTGGPSNSGTAFKFSSNGTLTVLYTFCSQANCKDGAQPEGRLLGDKAGNLYGTTEFGGAYNAGTVFEIKADGTETALYSFAGGNDGAWPQAGLIADKKGNFYGTTSTGGGPGCSGHACGTVFKLAPSGVETVLHAFGTGTDGANPIASLIADKKGNLYGTTSGGGGIGCGGDGCGIVFEVARDGTETILHSFEGGSDGNYPTGALFEDLNGNLYGTTGEGGTGCGSAGCGTIFELTPSGTKTVLYAFLGGSDGSGPNAELLADKKGNFYSTTQIGGSANSGTVFKLSTDRIETVLYSFLDGVDGGYPNAGLVRDKANSLYGTTVEGGLSNCGNEGCGVVFRLRK